MNIVVEVVGVGGRGERNGTWTRVNTRELSTWNHETSTEV
jgi:hypothetical protein